MEPLAPNGSQFGSQNDPNHILNECRDIDRGIDQIKANLNNLTTLQQRALDDPDSSAQSSTNRQLDALSSETMTMYRNFAGRIRVLKSQPDSGSPKNAPQVGRVDRSLKTAIQEYQSLDSAFRKKLQDQMARQYRIVRSDATDDEVRRAVEATSSQQVFSQALLQSDRRGQSRAALNAVENRHAAIQKIESQIIELAKLFEDMDVLVVQQEAAVINVEDQGVRIVDDLNKGTQQLNTAVVSAKNARKWKWWCLGICGMFIIPPLSYFEYSTRLIRKPSSPHHNNHHRRCPDLQIRHPDPREDQALAHRRLPRHAVCSRRPCRRRRETHRRAGPRMDGRGQAGGALRRARKRVGAGGEARYAVRCVTGRMRMSARGVVFCFFFC